MKEIAKLPWQPSDNLPDRKLAQVAFQVAIGFPVALVARYPI
jgi:hypothetical protein